MRVVGEYQDGCAGNPCLKALFNEQGLCQVSVTDGNISNPPTPSHPPLSRFVGPSISPVAPVCLQALAQMLVEVCGNPKNPGFNHYLFER